MYLVTMAGHEPFLTPFFDPENHFIFGMTVCDLTHYKYTIDGKTWQDIQTDHL